MFADFMISWVDRDFYKKTQKMKVLKNGSPAIKITNEARTSIFSLSRASHLPYGEKILFDYFIYNYI